MPEDKDNSRHNGRDRTKALSDGEEGSFSDREEENQEEEKSRKYRLGLNKSGGDDKEGLSGGDHDFDDDEVENVLENINNCERLEDGLLASLSPSHLPRSLLHTDEEEEEGEDNEEEGGLSKSGKEMQQLIGRLGKKDEDVKTGADAENDDDDDHVSSFVIAVNNLFVYTDKSIFSCASLPCCSKSYPLQFLESFHSHFTHH
ncbi:hypothetical protein GIB67_018025 [Kingdonia uniflora]|uniref:Uncharacterized protein n=1 Tax=Kingdonia uniflora TaxID=39325 RepID=A0A7J7NWB3_9MAGN|nr:hypothetical protein GIB67_018025 [Kingdonia uniflora]